MVELKHSHIKKRDIVITVDGCDRGIIDTAVEYIKEYDGPRDTMLDIGAHVGCSSAYFAAELGFKRIMAIEAYWENFRVLINNIYCNQLEDVITPMWAAVALRTGEWRPMYWARERSNHGQYSTFFKPGYHHQSDFAQTISFEHVLSLFDNIDVLKCDIEGCEYEIFSPSDNLKESLRRVRFIDLETHGVADGVYFELDCFAEYGYPDLNTANEKLATFLEYCGFDLDPEGVLAGRMQGYNRRAR